MCFGEPCKHSLFTHHLSLVVLNGNRTSKIHAYVIFMEISHLFCFLSELKIHNTALIQRPHSEKIRQEALTNKPNFLGSESD